MMTFSMMLRSGPPAVFEETLTLRLQDFQVINSCRCAKTGLLSTTRPSARHEDTTRNVQYWLQIDYLDAYVDPGQNSALSIENAQLFRVRTAGAAMGSVAEPCPARHCQAATRATDLPAQLTLDR